MLCAAGPLWITVSSPWAARLRRHVRSRPWLLFEWDDHNNIHELPPGTDPGGRVGVGVRAGVGIDGDEQEVVQLGLAGR